jgi:hypothetical protein
MERRDETKGPNGKVIAELRALSLADAPLGEMLTVARDYMEGDCGVGMSTFLFIQAFDLPYEVQELLARWNGWSTQPGDTDAETIRMRLPPFRVRTLDVPLPDTGPDVPRTLDTFLRTNETSMWPSIRRDLRERGVLGAIVLAEGWREPPSATAFLALSGEQTVLFVYRWHGEDASHGMIASWEDVTGSKLAFDFSYALKRAREFAQRNRAGG